MLDGIIKSIRNFLEENDIDPFYAITLFGVLISLSYWKDFKNWEKRPDWVKSLAGTTLVGTIIFSIISLLRLVGIINF
jgi:hypothetical protein